CSNFDAAAHYDYINRYTDNLENFVLYEDCPAEFDRMFEALITKGKALEINTKSIQKHKERSFKRHLPDPAVLNRYREMGGKLICLGSDSHFPGTFGVCFDEAVQYLKSLGFKESVYFKAHKPVFEPL
ncbi:MAG: histidinol phosphate phosphatase, partial [Saccharofermentans sp.]|nr:histidinol phosphate phosphatase [Saccharofermentans sp.]